MPLFNKRGRKQFYLYNPVKERRDQADNGPHSISLQWILI